MVRSIPGYTLLTYITGTDPLTDEQVSVSPQELIETLLTYGPFGAAVGPVLQAIEVLGEIFTFVSESLDAHGLTFARIKRDIDSAWDELSVTNGIRGNVAIVERYVDAFLHDVGAFVESIVDRVLEMVRAVVAEVAEPLLETPEIAPIWNLTKKVLHYDPLRGVEVNAPTAEIIADFLRLIGQERAARADGGARHAAGDRRLARHAAGRLLEPDHRARGALRRRVGGDPAAEPARPLHEPRVARAAGVRLRPARRRVRRDGDR